MKKCAIVVYLSIAVLAACQPAKNPTLALQGTAMGTTFSVTIVDNPIAAFEPPDIATIIGNLNGEFSTYDPNSSLSKFNQHKSTEWFTTTAELCSAIENAKKVSVQTNASFDITIGRLVNLWGFGPDEIVLEPPANESIRAANESAGHTKMHTRCEQNMIRKDYPELYVDLSGYAKGIAVDTIAVQLLASGYTNFLVEVGGEIRTQGKNSRGKSWRIAIERPGDGILSIDSAINLSNASLATSGDYRNYFEHTGRRYSHTIDPRTGRPVTHATASVTVIEESAALADALATALLVMGHEEGVNFATTHSIAAYFLIRNDDEFDAIASPQFVPYLE